MVDAEQADVELPASFGQDSFLKGNWTVEVKESVGAIANLSNVAVGAGLLSFPYVFYQTGIFWGFFIIIFISIILGILADMMAHVCEKIKFEHPHRILTYETITVIVLGKTISLFVMIFVIVTVFSSQVALTIIIGDMTQPILLEYSSNSDVWFISRTFTTTLIMISLVLPLCCFKQISYLKWTSALAIFSLGVVSVIVVLACLRTIFIEDIYLETRGEILVFKTSWNIFAAIPIVTFALGFHISIPSIFEEFPQPLAKPFRFVVVGTLFICIALYGFVGAFGYFEFGEATEGNILQNFPADSFFPNFARVCMTITAICSYPLMNFVNRKSIDFVIESIASWYWAQNYILPSSKYYFLLRTIIVSLLLMLVALIFALKLPQIQFVFGLAGSICVPATMFIVPCLLCYKSFPQYMHYGKILPLVIGVIGVFISIMGTLATVFDIVDYLS